MAPVPLNLIALNELVHHDGRSSRQRITCRYRCGNACVPTWNKLLAPVIGIQAETLPSKR